jgi:tetrapyrrole methylase family protein/MazG family protein
MPQITVVGLGPGSSGDLTREAWRTLEEASEVWLRTLHHPVVSELPATCRLQGFDAVYERGVSFADVYAEIAARVLALGHRAEGVVYAVPGHPLVGEATVTRILQDARGSAIPVRIVHGLSFIEPALAALELDALDGLQVFDALELVSLNHPPLNPDYPALIAQVYSRAVASDLKLVLMNQYADDHPTVWLDGAGTSRAQVRHMPLYEIDRHEATPLTTLFVAPQPAVSSFEGFQETIARLRSPTGCPWDREQTHRSLRSNLLEESYEVLEAIDADDPDTLREELGDLLLQVVLHAQIAVEDGEFGMSEVISQIDSKLKRRHPHVWGSVDVEGVGDVVTNWEAIKRRERADKGAEARSLLDGIPRALPALAQAAAYTDRAGRIGFDRIDAEGIWVDLGGAIAASLNGTLASLGELRGDTAQGADGGQALGDVLLVVADWARRNQIDPEAALREANERFAWRFATLETASREGIVTLDAASTAEGRQNVLALWKENGMA